MSGYIYESPHRGWLEPARVALFGAIVDAYSAVGTAIGHPGRIHSIYNLTDEDVWISLDGVNNHFPVLKAGGSITDLASDGLVIPKGTIFYVKRFTAGVAPTLGSVVISIAYKV